MKSLATSCPEELSKGNVLAWPDFLSGIVGKVKVDSKSIFCSGENLLLTSSLPSFGYPFFAEGIIQNFLVSNRVCLSVYSLTLIHIYFMPIQRTSRLLKYILYNKVQISWEEKLDKDKIGLGQ